MTVSSQISSRAATILVVEDDERVRRGLVRAFESEGHRVVACGDAAEALRELHRQACDLIVLDIELPGVSGLALCRLLRAQAATRRLPVIVLSSHDREEYKVEAFTAGADDFVVKGATPRELLTRAGAHLEAAERERALQGSNRELAFIADLGRGLLHALSPAEVVRRVAGATYEGADASVCAAALIKSGGEKGKGDRGKREDAGLTVCVFDREGSAEEDAALLDVGRLRAWLASAPSTSKCETGRTAFFLKDGGHTVEYTAPLRFEGSALGALIVAFDSAADCDQTAQRLVDAAAQQAALAARISTLYEAARSASVYLAREVERRTAEAESQRRFTEAIIDSLPVSLYAVDRDHRVVAWNRNRELGGQGIPRRDVLGRNVFEVLTRQPRETLKEEFERAFETGEIERIEQETRSPDGSTRHWLVSKVPMKTDGEEVSHVITVGEDITARVEANRAVARTEKLAAVGRLAAGVVHEINNPLATISACAEALESRVSEGIYGADVEDLREYLQLIRGEAFRCKQITNGLLDFSRARAAEHAPVNVSEVVESAARLLAHQKRGVSIRIEVELAERLPLVSGDFGQLQQAVIILAENAVDAMPEGGTLTLRTLRDREEESEAVVVEVRDTGQGIPVEIRERIFDPFFTTKEVGRGTGLGLAVCYGIVTEHGGRIAVDSTVGRGTVFRISLPATKNSDGE
ncbi:MAG TPA: response regulator [Pyrinomonadaceae bacterium]|jgi:two-component system NtrC family sensor kinase|nr:response regulator [Pyrinomonadaceae bacterium]